MDESMQVEPHEFRRILGHWASGVAVVATTTAAGELRGLTANAVASVSLDPPLVLACVERDADTHDAIRDAGFFSVSVLQQQDERSARRFAGDEADKFRGVAYHMETTGAPILDAALAWVDCRLRDAFDGGDHTIFVGQVVDGDAREGEPLVYYRGGYNRLMP
jgi:flavin reductase (DIM6/NTAB) family NADH-FMN oxidoreductase RutF